jgi:hypothetical protein
VQSTPIEIIWNNDAWAKVLAIFIRPNQAFILTPEALMRMNKSAMRNAAIAQGKMHLEVDLESPKIVWPDHCELDNGCLVLDMGYCLVCMAA